MTSHMTILSALKEKFETLKNNSGKALFTSVTIETRPVTPESMFDLHPDMTEFPAAVLVPGETLPANGGLTATLTLDLFLITEDCHSDGPSGRHLRLLENILEILSPDSAGKAPSAGGAHLLAVNAKTEMFGDAYPGWRIRLKACHE